MKLFFFLKLSIMNFEFTWNNKKDYQDEDDEICFYPGCNAPGSFGFKGDIFVYCLTHGKPGMINLHIDKCYKNNCKKKTFKLKPIKPRPSPYETPLKKRYFLIVNDTRPKIPWAITCIRKNCGKNASYNVIGDPNPLYCLLHAENNMVNVMIDKCHIPSCLYKKREVFCDLHAKELENAKISLTKNDIY